MRKGYFISFEGGDGSGKSTQIRRLRSYFEEKGYDVVLTREPGGTDIGEKIRRVILDPANKKMSGIAEAMLYAASRAQHVEEVIAPALEAGKIVICDRFVDSSIAYQGYGRNLGECVTDINKYAVGACMPDITFFLKLKPDQSHSRMRNRKKDRIELEAEEFHRNVYEGYEALENKFPERIIGIDASGTIEEVHECILLHIEKLLDQR